MENTAQYYTTPKPLRGYYHLSPLHETCEVCGHVGKFGSFSDKDAEIMLAEYRTPEGFPGFRYECKNIDACLDRKGSRV